MKDYKAGKWCLKSVYIPVLTTFLTFIFFSECNTTEPPIDNTEPGRRDYVWTVDTLKVPEGRSIPYWMWGSSANNVWAVGLSYLNAYCIWHYNGQSWNNYNPDKYIDPGGICGFNSNDIWIGSTDGALWHYNGAEWSKFTVINIPNYHSFFVQGISGSSPNNIYAVGFADSIDGSTYKAIIVHYNGTKWVQVNIPTVKNSFTEIQYAKNTNEFLIKGNVFENSIEFIYKFNGIDLIELVNNSSNSEDISLNTIGSEVYLAWQGKIYRYENSKLNLFKDFSEIQYAGKVWGRTEKDFFTINWDGIGHYNGTDLITIYKKWNDDWFPGGGIVFEKDVFLIWDDSYNTFIVHGKLMN